MPHPQIIRPSGQRDADFAVGIVQDENAEIGDVGSFFPRNRFAHLCKEIRQHKRHQCVGVPIGNERLVIKEAAKILKAFRESSLKGCHEFLNEGCIDRFSSLEVGFNEGQNF